VHLHCLVTDGAFVAEPEPDPGTWEQRAGRTRWLAAPPLAADDLRLVLAALRDDLSANEDDDDAPDVEASLAACVQLSLAGPVRSVFDDPPAPTPSPLSVAAFGMSLHADTFVDGRDRRRLERLCRYLLRPPFAHDAVTALPDGRVRVHFKRPDRRGVTHVDMPVDRFLARLCALVPPPRAHRVNYFGVFSNAHRLRALVVPARPAAVSPPQLSLLHAVTGRPLDASSLPTIDDARSKTSRRTWSQLLARVFSVDVTICGACGGPTRIVEAVTDAARIALLLHGARPPPRASPPDQLGLFAS
jgi:hypothetical protein